MRAVVAAAAIATVATACGDNVAIATVAVAPAPHGIDNLAFDRAGRAIAIENPAPADVHLRTALWILDGETWRRELWTSDDAVIATVSRGRSEDAVVAFTDFRVRRTALHAVTPDGVLPLPDIADYARYPRRYGGEYYVQALGGFARLDYLTREWIAVAELAGWRDAIRDDDGTWYGFTDGALVQWTPGGPPVELATAPAQQPTWIAGPDDDGAIYLGTNTPTSTPDDGSAGSTYFRYAGGEMRQIAVDPDPLRALHVTASGKLVALTAREETVDDGALSIFVDGETELVDAIATYRGITLAADADGTLYLLEVGRLSRVEF